MKMQITNLRFHLSPVRMAMIKKQLTTNVEVMGKEEPPFTIGGKVKWSSHSGNQYGDY